MQWHLSLVRRRAAFFGVEPVILDPEGQEIEGAGEGLLMIKQSWPSQIRTVFNDHQRCVDTYFSAYPGVLLYW